MLSPRLQDTYQFICRYIASHDYPPLLSEIALGIGIQSKGVVHRYLASLVDEGLITLTPGKHRGIRLVESERSHQEKNRYTLPLLGRIAAGLPIAAIEDHNEVDLSEFFMGPNRFVLKVQGDSMIEAGILDGDMVIIEKRSHANDDEIVVALVDNDEATLKYLRRNSDGSITLIPANASLSPMLYAASRVQIQGVVIGQLRSYR